MDFLQRLYTCGIMPRECHNRPDCNEYDKLGKQSQALQEQLQDGLSKEQTELLEKLMETQLGIHAYEQAVAFAEGFRIGGRLVTELYRDTD